MSLPVNVTNFGTIVRQGRLLTGKLRWDRRGPRKDAPVLQQESVVECFKSGSSVPTERWPEWDDVPEITEAQTPHPRDRETHP